MQISSILYLSISLLIFYDPIQLYFMKKGCLLILAGILSFIFILSCQKEYSYEGGAVTTPTPKDTMYTVDDATQVTASVNGVVLDENNNPFPGATVRCGTQTMVTNILGVFFFKNISISKNNGSVTVTKSGYFKGTRNFLAAGPILRSFLFL